MMHSILEKGYDRLLDEYKHHGKEAGRVVKFGLTPAWNAIIGTYGCCGVAMSFRGNNPEYGYDETSINAIGLKKYIGASLFDVAADNMSEDIVSRRSMAVAALNALSQPFLSERTMTGKGYCIRSSMDGIVKENDIVAIVGHGGLVKEYAGRCKELHVTDMRPKESFTTVIVGETIEYGPGNIYLHSANENEEVLSSADVVFITGSTLVNGTFEEVTHYARNARTCCLYGTSAQLLPDVLFENGIDLVMSVSITDPVRFEKDLMDETDVETALKKHQKKYTVSKEP